MSHTSCTVKRKLNKIIVISHNVQFKFPAVRFPLSKRVSANRPRCRVKAAKENEIKCFLTTMPKLETKLRSNDTNIVANEKISHSQLMSACYTRITSKKKKP